MEFTRNEKRLLDAANRDTPNSRFKLILIAVCLGTSGGLMTVVFSLLERPISLHKVAYGLVLIGAMVMQYAYYRLMNDSVSLVRKLRNNLPIDLKT